MRKLILVGIMFLTVGLYASEIKTFLDIPNLKACSYYDFNNSVSCFGAQSAILEYKSLDLNVGYVNISGEYSGTFSISVNPDKLHIANVNYAWAGLINTDLGIWLGYNMQSKTTSWGICASLVNIEK